MNRWIEYLIEQGYIEPSSGAGSQAIDALPASIVQWSDEWRGIYEERAAIMQYDGGLARLEAEKRAEGIVRTMYGRRSISRG